MAKLISNECIVVKLYNWYIVYVYMMAGKAYDVFCMAKAEYILMLFILMFRFHHLNNIIEV